LNGHVRACPTTDNKADFNFAQNSKTHAEKPQGQSDCVKLARVWREKHARSRFLPLGNQIFQGNLIWHD
jgi:hypothetical protein